MEILANEIVAVNDRYEAIRYENLDEKTLLSELNMFYNVDVNFIEKNTLNHSGNGNKIHYVDVILRLFLKRLGDYNLKHIKVYKSEDYYKIELEKEDGFLLFNVNKNRLFVKRIDLIIFWNILSLTVITMISVVFIKNQVRSIKKLETFANEFSHLEKDNIKFKPTGAKEIREVGEAFIELIKKLRRLVSTRTTMLAQISHDLRTPLTRMKLQTEFIEDKETAEFFKQDLEEMEKMINEYLLFAKGERENNFSQINIKEFFDEIIDNYSRSGYNIGIIYDLKINGTFLNVDSFKRCINNLINNAIKYHKKFVNVSVKTNNKKVIINVEDDGCGIAEEYINKIKMPFYKIKDTGNGCENVGLGLSIVQSVVNAHRGKLFFKKSKEYGGLSVELNIPIIKNKKWSR